MRINSAFILLVVIISETTPFIRSGAKRKASEIIVKGKLLSAAKPPNIEALKYKTVAN
jgi:hypothetical protein